MADVAAGPGPEGAASWSRDLSDEDQLLVYVPGVSAERNFSARHLLRNQKAEAKAKKPVAAVSVPPMDALKPAGETAGQQVPDKGGVKSASLKDLCPEDKRRIANLIKELARVSEEKEVTEERLKAEQESFEKKIRQLEEQNELIIKEREALQQQYRECQELLSLYQKYLSEQQEKLTHSLSELEAAKQKAHQMSHERSLCQPVTHFGLDGSYLNIAKPQTLYKNNRSGPFASGAQPCRNSHVPEAPILDGRSEDQNQCLQENGLHGKYNNLVSPGQSKELPHMKRTPDTSQRSSECPIQTCVFHKKACSSDHSFFQDGYHTPRRSTGLRCESSPDYSCPSRSSGPNGSTGSGSKEEGRGKRLSEDRRKQLLLQKMELEIEKERLQNLLAEKEARLLLQQQQLQQSRLAYSRFKGHPSNSEELLIDAALMRPGGTAPVMNGPGGGLSPPRPDREGCYSRTPASARSCRTPGSGGGNGSGKKMVGFGMDAEEGVPWRQGEKERVRPRRGTASGSRKDAATSPGLTGCRKELVTAATSPIRHDTTGYEASLFDLVEAMSPGLQHHCSERCGHHRVLAPQSGSRKNPGWSRRHSGARNGAAELEESRILEEIFFI
ncbi:protein hinderin [Eublepharis macularius]|uniref:Protein hinderin n=1 Tax=Eublepharis macularius TaxID=481883 RepID=A0AA97JPA1_EUBMA|nr:protein hinderin [Eublepharis macularius]